jgi:hypothetical protein
MQELRDDGQRRANSETFEDSVVYGGYEEKDRKATEAGGSGGAGDPSLVRRQRAAVGKSDRVQISRMTYRSG